MAFLAHYTANLKLSRIKVYAGAACPAVRTITEGGRKNGKRESPCRFRRPALPQWGFASTVCPDGPRMTGAQSHQNIEMTLRTGDLGAPGVQTRIHSWLAT